MYYNKSYVKIRIYFNNYDSFFDRGYHHVKITLYITAHKYGHGKIYSESTHMQMDILDKSVLKEARRYLIDIIKNKIIEGNMEIPKCIRCKSGDVAISNIDGYECMNCGAWFDIDEDENTIWAYDHLPSQI